MDSGGDLRLSQTVVSKVTNGMQPWFVVMESDAFQSHIDSMSDSGTTTTTTTSHQLTIIKPLPLHVVAMP